MCEWMVGDYYLAPNNLIVYAFPDNLSESFKSSADYSIQLSWNCQVRRLMMDIGISWSRTLYINHVYPPFLELSHCLWNTSTFQRDRVDYDDNDDDIHGCWLETWQSQGSTDGTLCGWPGTGSLDQSLTRGQKVQSRREREIWNSFLQFGEEKENSEIPFSSFEKGKRNLQKASPLLRREREWHFLFSGFERRKRNFEKNLKFREEKRNLKFLIPVSRKEREICKKVLLFWEEKEKLIFFSQVSWGDSGVPSSPYKLIFVKIWALFGQKCRQNSSFCDSDVFLCNRNREGISEIERSKIFISNKSCF